MRFLIYANFQVENKHALPHTYSKFNKSLLVPPPVLSPLHRPPTGDTPSSIHILNAPPASRWIAGFSSICPRVCIRMIIVIIVYVLVPVLVLKIVSILIHTLLCLLAFFFYCFTKTVTYTLLYKCTSTYYMA